ncbi:MAG: type I polyketide synthase, partial [Blastocatellia bacterium]|nr:type I polyketide synthase [Blastocatellia bacterium]
DYGRLQIRDFSSNQHVSTGSALSIIANRLSYILNLRGPSLSVDTACSSSLVAVHLACQSLWNGESSVALAGGVNLVLDQNLTNSLEKAGFLSPDGQCKAFDSRANGYVRGEGIGVVVLKPLSKALTDNDQIYALILGSAVNQDGRTNGLTAPNGQSQESVLKAALQMADLSPAEVQYIEAHGTGTALGDPIEVDALHRVVGQNRRGNKCIIGSVKTNIGHLEAAAGIAGLIKVALCLRHRELVPSLHFKESNPYIPFDELAVEVQKELSTWPKNVGARGEVPRLAGVSSFGFGGTNAHILVGEMEERKEEEEREEEREEILVISGKRREDLEKQIERYKERMKEEREERVRDISYSAAVRRSHQEKRVGVVGKGKEEIRRELERVKIGRRIEKGGKIAYVCAGQGTQWEGMWKEQVQEMMKEEEYRKEIEKIDREMRKYTGKTVREEMEEGRVEETEVGQRVLFAVEAGLGRLWQSWGVRMEGVVGHSVGEVVGAYLSGRLSIEEAVRVVCERGRVMREVRGKMAAVGMRREEAEARYSKTEVTIAAYNSPSSVVITGEEAEVAEEVRRLREEGIWVKELNVKYAFHSKLMQDKKQELRERLAEVRLEAGREVEMISTVSLGWEERYDGSYWAENIRSSVRFAEAIEEMVKRGYRVFVELSPHTVLKGYIEEILDRAGVEGCVVGSLHRAKPCRRSMLSSLAAIYSSGIDIDWSAVYPSGRLLSLPSYPWSSSSFWLKEKTSSELDLAKTGSPLLHNYIKPAYPAGVDLWESHLSQQDCSYTYTVGGEMRFSVGVMLEMVLAAAKKVCANESYTISNLQINSLPNIDTEQLKKFQTVITNQSRNSNEVRCFSFQAEQPSQLLHLQGEILLSEKSSTPIPFTLAELRAKCHKKVDVSEFYETLAYQGLAYGRNFQVITQLLKAEDEVLAKLELSQIDVGLYQLHPLLFEACLQTISLITTSATTVTQITALRLYQTEKTENFWSYAQVTQRSENRKIGQCYLFNEQGQVVAEFIGMELTELGSAQNFNSWLYSVEWQSRVLAKSTSTSSGQAWLVVTDESGFGDELLSSLEFAGETCIKVSLSNNGYRMINKNYYQVHPLRAGDFEQLFRTAFNNYQRSCRAIIHCSGLTGVNEATLVGLEKAQQTGSGSLLSIIQTVIQTGWRNMPSLYLITSNTQPVDTLLLDVTQSPLWGMGLTVMHEHPELNCRCIDLSAEPEQELNALTQELLSEDAERQIVLRKHQRYVARLRHKTILKDRVLKISSKGSYLITGGTGGLGLLVAEWLVKKGARSIVLVSRSGINEATQEVTKKLTTSGAKVVVKNADVTNRDEVGQLLNDIDKDFPPLCGIIHAAAIIDDTSLLKLDYQRFHKVMAAKVYGAWNLHRLTLHRDLELFLLFSSAASIVGSPGQASYVAANTFLDMLSYHRRQLGKAALSINWGPWAEVGLAAVEEKRGKRMSFRGIGSINPSQGLEILEQLLSSDSPQVAVMSLNLRQWRQFYPRMANLPLLTQLSSLVEEKKQQSRIREELVDKSFSDRQLLLENYVKQHIAYVLQLTAEEIDSEAPLQTLGLDSIMAVELRNRLESDLNTTLSATMIWSYPTVKAVALHLADKMGISLQPTVSIAVPEESLKKLSQSESEKAVQFLLEVKRLESELLSDLSKERGSNLD